MFEKGIVEPEKLKMHFLEIEPFLYKYPAIAAAKFEEAVDDFIEDWTKRTS